MNSFVIGLLAMTVGPGWPYQTASPTTFYQSIRPILDRSCSSCHRLGGSAPFSFRTYAEVKQRIDLVSVQLLARSMPPHILRSDTGSLTNYTIPSDEDLVLYQKWIQAKMPEGKALVDSGISPYESTLARKLGKPNAILQTPDGFPLVSADGAPYWRAVVIEGLKEDFDLQGFEVVPFNRKVVRSVQIALVPKDSPLKSGESFLTAGSLNASAQDLIGVYGPGTPSFELPSLAKKVIPAGRKFIVQALYQPSGRTEEGGMAIRLYKSASSQRKAAQYVVLSQDKFEIPANASPTLEARHTLDKPAWALSVWPEARFFAAEVKLTAKLPGGKTVLLFENVRWDPLWQGNSMFAKPLLLPANTEITATISYNNDEHCQMNEGKKAKAILSGSTLDDELFRVGLLLAPL